MKKLKLKIGDSAKVIKNESSHNFPIGQKIKIKELYQNAEIPHYKAENENKDQYYLTDSELKKISKK